MERRYFVCRESATGPRVVAGGDVNGPGPLTIEEAQRRLTFYGKIQGIYGIFEGELRRVENGARVS